MGMKESPTIPTGNTMQIDEAETEIWMNPIWNFIKNGTLPTDKVEARRIRYKAARYVIYDGIHNMRGFDQPLLKCIEGKKCTYIMWKIHEGIYENHAGAVPSL